METEIRSRGSERAGECIALRRQRCFVTGLGKGFASLESNALITRREGC